MVLTSSELDSYFQQIQERILQAYNIFGQVYDIIDNLATVPTTYITVGNVSLPCISSYLEKQQTLFASYQINGIESFNDAYTFVANFFGMTTNQQRFDKQSVTPQCSVQAYQMNYNTPFSYYPIRSHDIYKTLPMVLTNVYLAISGSAVNMYVDGTLAKTFDMCEFVFTDNTSEIYFESNSPFAIEQYTIQAVGDYQELSNLPTDLVDLTFESYIQVPVYLWTDNFSYKQLILPNDNGVYHARLINAPNGTVNIMHVQDFADDIDMFSLNIFRNFAWSWR